MVDFPVTEAPQGEEKSLQKRKKKPEMEINGKEVSSNENKGKENFYHMMVNDLIEKEQNQWYSQLKRLTNKGKTDKIVVDEISHLTDKEQAECIADHISAVSQEYDHLQTKDIEIVPFLKNSTPHISVQEVSEHLKLIKTKKATALGDVPAKLIKVAADHLAAPLADILNSGIRLGQWSDI